MAVKQQEKKEKKKSKQKQAKGLGNKKMRKWANAPHDRNSKDRSKRFRVPPNPPKK